MKITFQKSTLRSGAKLVTENHPYSKSFSVGFWVNVGSRFENPEIAGITHFLEHLTFKGTKKRSAFEIAQSLESYGGDLNAFTTKEHTCFHGLVLKENWQQALEILVDITTNMKFSSKDFKNEKNVVIQEIGMSEDTPDDIIYDYLLEALFPNHPMGKPILGQIGTIHRLKEAQVYDYYNTFYQGENLVISCAGNLNHKKVESYLNSLLSKKKTKDNTLKKLLLDTKGFEKPEFHRCRLVREKATEQTHLLLALPSSTFTDELRMEAFIVNSLLGGGMTSKLFQSVRENKGLAYSVQSFLHTLKDTGFITIQAASDGKKIKELTNVILKELKLLKKKGISKKEIEFYKNQIKGSILLGSEDIENRMNSLAVNELVFAQPKSVAQIQREIEKISYDSVHEYLDNYLQIDKLSGILLGPKVENQSLWWEQFN
ncbi:MAG: insulinase family protein [Bdellovibrionaceae bacterium]|nr:insulinase family protein [Pseudobdellovibrionaceae bacterium]